MTTPRHPFWKRTASAAVLLATTLGCDTSSTPPVSTDRNPQGGATGDAPNGTREKVVLYHDGGAIHAIAHVHDGVKHGPYSGWYPDGRPQWEETYDRGSLHGVCTYWHANGMKQSEAEYRNGQPHGQWTEWDEHGSMTRVRVFKEGVLESEKSAPTQPVVAPIP